MRKFVCAMVVTVCAFSVAEVMGDEFMGRITNLDKNTITVSTKKKGEEAKERKLTLTADTKIVKGKFNKAEKKVEAGDAIEGGKTALTKMLDKAGEKGVFAYIVTDGDKVSEIRIFGKGKKKKNKD